MKSKQNKQQLTSKSKRPCWFHYCREIAALALSLLIVGLPNLAKAQTEVIYDFNSGNDVGWGHYDPGAALGQANIHDASSGAYRLFGPPTQCGNIINRGASYRSEQYQEFFQSVDLVNFDANMDASTCFLASRINPPSPSGPGQLSGYIAVYGPGTPRARQGLLASIEFTEEVIANFMDPYRGGAAPISQISPSRKLRTVFSGTNDTCKAELYDVTDLLEPLVRINFQDASGNSSVHASGENALGWLNLEFQERCDFTWDNYHSTGSRTTAVGFPGVPQVVNLKPVSQALFYQPPANSNITFTITTFSTTQIDTNALKMSLNDIDATGQLVLTEVRDTFPFPGTPNTNFFVRYTGVLASNTIYHGKITVLDMTGKGTTNNWYFDTFTSFDPTVPANPSGFVLIEAEDYNYNSGQFQDYPPVSGTDDTTTSLQQINPGNSTTETLGNQVNGGGTGYYDLAGMDDIDFHDNTTDSINAMERNQYRTMDRVGTVQGTKGGGFDTPRPYRTVSTRYVPDYIVSGVQPGDWLNYTRTFPSGNYNVYLRTSSQGRQDVRLDQVTAGSATSNQTTVLRGEFLVPNTQGLTRFRHVPLTDSAGNVQTLALNGTNTLRLTMNQERTGKTPADDFIGDIQLNWILFVPTTAPASAAPFIASASPSANSDNASPTPTVNIVVLNRTTSVSCPGSIQLWFDGVSVTSAANIACTTSEPGSTGATVSYRPPGFLLPGSVHSISLVFSDSSSTTQSNQWSFTVEPNTALLAPSDSVGGFPDVLFTVQANKAQNGSDPTACSLQGPFNNWIPRAEQQLAGQLINGDTQMPYPNEAAGTNGGFYTEPTAVHYEQCGGSTSFGPAKPFPGVLTEYAGNPGDPQFYSCANPGSGQHQSDPDHFAIAATIKLQLGPGAYRMGVDSDDEFKVTAGGSGGTNVFIAQSINTLPGTPNDGQFEFVVETNGIYMFRLVYDENEGSSHCDWYWVNRNTGAKELIRPLELLSSATVNGTYTYDSTALIDPGSKTITVPKSGNTRFYRLSSSTGYTLGRPIISGSNVVLTYQ